MKLLMINGSPKRNSTTFQIVKKVVEEMKAIDPLIESVELHLCDTDLAMCKGCYQCLSLGENRCPLKDDRELLEQKLNEADAVIFSSPVYVANVSALFKNFVDRFAYFCHRPRFHGKKAMVVCSAGSDGSGFVNILLTIAVETWGFDVVQKLGANVDPNLGDEERKGQWLRIEKKAKKSALAFYKEVRKTKKPVAKLTKLYTFQLQKKDFYYADQQRADYKYWKDKGWLDPKKAYYIDTTVNPVKLLIAKALANISRKNSGRKISV